LSDETIFGGEVLLREKPKWMKRTDLLALAGKILSGDLSAAVTSFVESHPQQIARASQVELLAPVPMDKELVDKLVAEKKLVRLGELIMDPRTRSELSSKLKDAISKAFEQAKQSGKEPESVPLEVVRTLLSPKLDRAGYGALVDEEAFAGKIERKADQLSLPGAGAPKGADAAATALQTQISAVLSEHLCLEITEVAKACGIDANKAKNTMQTMAKAGQLHIVAYDFAISPENLRKAHQALADIWQVKKNISPGDFRDGLSTTRKYAMALLQHFDDNKITRRLNEGRVLLRGPDKV
jgi:selenocysteine-specific elongation factor